MYVNCRCFISSWEFELHWNKISLQLTAFRMVLVLLGNTLDWSWIRIIVDCELCYKLLKKNLMNYVIFFQSLIDIWYMTLYINSALNVMQNSVMGLTEGGSILLPVKDSWKIIFQYSYMHVTQNVDIIFYILISFYTFTPVYNLLFVSWWRVIFIYNGEVETYLDNTVVVLEQCLLSQSVLYMFILYGAKFKVWWSFYP